MGLLGSLKSIVVNVAFPNPYSTIQNVDTAIEHNLGNANHYVYFPVDSWYNYYAGAGPLGGGIIIYSKGANTDFATAVNVPPESTTYVSFMCVVEHSIVK